MQISPVLSDKTIKISFYRQQPYRKSVYALRVFTGFMAIMATIPLFLFFLLQAGEEIGKAKTLPEVLDEKIPSTAVSQPENSYIYDKNGQLFSERIFDKNRVKISLSEVPDIAQSIFILTEDQNFMKHKGFDFSAIARAALVNIKEGGIEQGGSTITQQLSRNLFLTHERSYNRKLSELLYSYQLERKHSKEEILELYLNEIYFQNGVYGLGTAADYYFSKPLAKVSLAELVFICSIPNNPTLYDPLTHFNNAKERQERILNQLFQAGTITEAQLNQAMREKIKLRIQPKVDRYPDYSSYVYKELQQLISENEGFTAKLAKAKTAEQKKAVYEELDRRVLAVLQSGIQIHTGLDPAVQQTSIKALNRHLPYSDVEGAASVIDHGTNTIVAIAGGKKYEKDGFNRAFQAYRQPGSSIKPLLVYGPYLDSAHASAKTLVNAGDFCRDGYCPQNYGGARYGKVALETAFKYSYNTPAVRLLDEMGIETAFSYLNKFGFSKLSSREHVLPAALGGFYSGMTPLEMTKAYTAFANGGEYYNPHAITKVTDRKGKVLYAWKTKPVQVWSLTANEELRKLLAQTVRSGTAKRAGFSAPYVGGKTGTTNAFHDLWFIGLTDRYTAGVWVGKDKPSNIEGISRSAPHLKIWRDIMKTSQ